MKINNIVKFFSVICFSLVALCSSQNLRAETFITIGTGGITGVYYPTGNIICRFVNFKQKDHGIRCSYEATGGSIYNLNAIRDKELDFGIVQSDAQYNAVKGKYKFADKGPMEKLRSVFSIHNEAVTVIVRKDAGISSFEDIVGTKFNIGNPGSGQRGTMDVLMNLYGWKKSDFKLAAELKSAEQSTAVCNDQIQGFLFTAGHPNSSFLETTTRCDVMILNLDDDKIKQLVKDNPYYSHAVIPGKLYRGNPNDTKTFGSKATLVTSTDMPEEVVYEVVKAVFERFSEFRKSHPTYQTLTKEEMVTVGNTAPLHSGAVKYYREVGLMK